jgi:putative lumazine-binding protein
MNPLESRIMNIYRARLLYLFAAGVIGAGFFLLWLNHASADEHAVLVPINRLLEGMAKRDASAVKASAVPGATFVSMQYGTLNQMTIEQFAERIGAGTTHIDERIHDPLVRIDNDLAVVWAPFTFHIEGKLDHCGTDLFSLVHNNGKWLIGSLSATLRKDCQAQ